MATKNSDIPLITTLPASKVRRYKWTRVCFTFWLLAFLVILIVVTNLGSSSSDTNWEQRLLEIPSTISARNNSFRMTSKPHILGSDQNTAYGLYFESQLLKWGYNTNVQYLTANVSRFGDARAYLFDNDTSRIQLNLSEATVTGDPSSFTSLRNQSFLGFATSGNITGNLLYVNYAHRSDFITLEALGINLTNTIGIARYGGGMFRGVKADMADQFGLDGLILYSDPKDYGFGDGIFPNGTGLPPSGYQRGSVRYTFKCPGNANPDRIRDRCNMNMSQIRPNIPLIAMGYDNAQLLMENMNGFATDQLYPPNINLSSWQGGMDFIYHTGITGINSTNVNLYIDNSIVEATISNVFGFIKGTKYVNETILIGGHRDAWVFGAADPISGQTALLEIAKAFGIMVDEGFEPLRNIMIASWDAEEQSLIGSSMFTEVDQEMVESTIITYLNLDTVVSGPYLWVNADPLIGVLCINMMKKVKAPYSDNDDTLYDLYKRYMFNNSNDVYTGILGSGSDFVPFYHHYGINGAAGGMTGTYGTYHSVYDSYTFMEIVDPLWERNIAIAQYFSLITYEMVTNDIIPFNVTNLYVSMKRWLTDIDNIGIEYDCNWNIISPDAVTTLSDSIESFGDNAKLLDEAIMSLSSNDDGYENIVLLYNDALKKLTRQFLIEDGLPGRKYFKNVLVAPDILSGYSAYPFPYVVYSFQFDCTASYIDETVAITSDTINKATAFIQTYL